MLGIEALDRGFTTFADVLVQRALTDAERTAGIFLRDGEVEEATLTYGQLHRRVQAAAERLAARIRPGERAILLYPQGLDFIVAFFACLYTGVIPVPVSVPTPRRGFDVVRGTMLDSGATCLLSTGTFLSRFNELVKLDAALGSLACFDTQAWPAEPTQPVQPRRALPSDAALLQYTSGSTGSPRGVVVTHGNLLDNHRQLALSFGHDVGTVVVSWLPMFHDMGLGTVLGALSSGGCCVLMAPAAFLQQPLRWLRAITRYRATSSGGPNFGYDLCVQRINAEELAKLDLSSWRAAYNGAEPVRASTLSKFVDTFAAAGFRAEAMHPVYGLAEATLFVTGLAAGEATVVRPFSRKALSNGDVQHDDSAEGQRLVGCGHTWLSSRVLIVNPETLQACPAGKVGEIWVSGPSVADGYWEKPSATEETFRAHTALGAGPFLRTGDLGFQHEGSLFVTGRCKDLIIIRGRNHYPQDIEATVSESHPALEPLRCAAFAIDADDGEQLVVVQEVKRSALHGFDAEGIFSKIRSAISDRHGLLTHAIVLLKPTTLPRTSSGKVRRQVCRRGFLENTLASVASSVFGAEPLEPAPLSEPGLPPQPSRQQLEGWVVTWLSRRLRVEGTKIDASRSFADHGIDSVTAVELARALSDRLGSGLDETLLWSFPTIDALVQYLTARAATQPAEPQRRLDQAVALAADATDLEVELARLESELRRRP
jgi:acyl-CoA synthetase (AMP-forming)/AMP-acid ligase II/acyl carrier protein